MNEIERLARSFVEHEVGRNGTRQDRLELIGSPLEQSWVDVFTLFQQNHPGAGLLFERIVELSAPDAAASFAELFTPVWIEAGGKEVVDWLARSSSPAVNEALKVVIIPSDYVDPSNQSLEGRVYVYGGSGRRNVT